MSPAPLTADPVTADPFTADSSTAGPLTVGPLTAAGPAADRKGRRWVVWSFIACPCHLPVTLAVLATVLGGTGLGAAIRDDPVPAALVTTSVWAAGTARGFWLLREARRGPATCTVPRTRWGRFVRRSITR